MPDKRPAQLPILPPNLRQLLARDENLLQTLQLIVSSIDGRNITNLDVAGSLALQENPTAYTISGGAITLQEGVGQNTASRSAIAVETQGGIASDDLDTINGGRDGMLLFARAYDNAHDVVVKNGTGNIILEDDVTLDSYDKYLLLIYSGVLSKWLHLTGTTGGTGVAGTQGDTGVQGATGIQGDTGAAGSAGAQGDTGVQGATGIDVINFAYTWFMA